MLKISYADFHKVNKSSDMFQEFLSVQILRKYEKTEVLLIMRQHAVYLLCSQNYKIFFPVLEPDNSMSPSFFI